MPRKPTALARQAREGIITLVSSLASDEALPTLRELGATFDLHPSTMFRMLRDLAAEGILWQHPGGRFFSAATRRQNLKGAPLCFIGREMWQWSRLYQEILEGVSEVCSANGSPLVTLSAPSLVRQSDPTHPPQFSTPRIQQKEMAALLTAVPRGCAGLVLDHLWKQSALALPGFPGGERIQLLHGTNQHARVISPDYRAGAVLVHRHILTQGFTEAVLVTPFEGDPAVQAALEELRKTLTGLTQREIPFRAAGQEIQTMRKAGRNNKSCLICPEDNIALALFGLCQTQRYDSSRSLIATQGTGVIHAPITRLRYDYHGIGRSAAAGILHGSSLPPLRPCLIPSPSCQR